MRSNESHLTHRPLNNTLWTPEQIMFSQQLPPTGGFPSQRASNGESFLHHVNEVHIVTVFLKPFSGLNWIPWKKCSVGIPPQFIISIQFIAHVDLSCSAQTFVPITLLWLGKTVIPQKLNHDRKIVIEMYHSNGQTCKIGRNRGVVYGISPTLA